MKFQKFGQETESNIFHQLDEKKQQLSARGVDVINLSIGTPDFEPDTHVMQAVSQAAQKPENYKYSLHDTPELIEAVQRWYQNRYDVSLAPEQIMSVSGSQEGDRPHCLSVRRRRGFGACPRPGLSDFYLWAYADRR